MVNLQSNTEDYSEGTWDLIAKLQTRVCNILSHLMEQEIRKISAPLRRQMSRKMADPFQDKILPGVGGFKVQGRGVGLRSGSLKESDLISCRSHYTLLPMFSKGPMMGSQGVEG